MLPTHCSYMYVAASLPKAGTWMDRNEAEVGFRSMIEHERNRRLGRPGSLPLYSPYCAGGAVLSLLVT